jgi:hypothetical protein
MLLNKKNDDSEIKPLHLNEIYSLKLNVQKKAENYKKTACILCDEIFNLSNNNEEKLFLTHLIVSHKIVIANANLIGDLAKYSVYWKEKLKKVKLQDIFFIIKTNCGINDRVQAQNFYLLSDDLPEDKLLREKLNIIKLEKVLIKFIPIKKCFI